MTAVIKLRIEFENVSFISNDDIIYSIIRTNLAEENLCVETMFSKYFRGVLVFLQTFIDVLKTINRDLKVHNMIPLKVELLDHSVNVIPIIPATAIKGLLRYSYDVQTAAERVKCYDINYISNKILENIILLDKKYIDHLIKGIRNIFVESLKVGGEIPSIIEELFVENYNFLNSYSMNRDYKLCLVLLSYALALQSCDSCLSIIDELSCSLPLSKNLLKIRKILMKIFGKRRNYTLCKSCLVFGCNGLKTPIVLFDAEPISDIRLIVRTFNNICQPESKRSIIAKTAPFTFVGFDKNAIFETKIVLRKTRFYELANRISVREHCLKYEDLVIEVLEKAVEGISKHKLGCVITFGRRGSVGYGRAFIRISNIKLYY